MADIFIVILATFAVLYCFIKYFTSTSHKQPPGPTGLPFLGYLTFLGKEPCRTFKELSEKYGNLFSIRLGSTPVVVCNDFKSVKEALNNPAILYRPPYLFHFHPGDLGFVSTSGPEWVEQRRYSMRYLKEYGLYNTTFEENLSAELNEFLSELTKLDGKPVDVCDILSLSVSNNMLSLILGRRIPAEDHRQYIVKDAADALAEVFGQAGPNQFFPKIAKFLAKRGISSLAEKYKKMDTLYKFLKDEVKERKMHSDWHDNILIDNYLKEMKNMKDKNLKSYFSEDNLIGNMQGMIHGGSETTRTSLQWLFLAMASFPHIQERIHEEIDRVLGKDGNCEFSDRRKLPYTYATIMEGQRWRTVASLSLTHRASEDTMIGEYHIEKDTFVITNLWALHNDSRYWKNPEVFQSERFLIEDGSLSNKEPESYMPFGAGRRICPGKTLAMMEIFKYFTAVMQRFDVLPTEDHPPILTGITGVTYHPESQKLRYKLRH